MNEINQRPNILWICTDQQRYDTIGALGNPHVSTPNLDKLVQGGVAFERAYCQSPICTPSRASFLTGMYPKLDSSQSNGNPVFPDFPPLISKILADAATIAGLSESCISRAPMAALKSGRTMAIHFGNTAMPRVTIGRRDMITRIGCGRRVETSPS